MLLLASGAVGNYNIAAVLTFVFPLVLFGSAMLWLFYERRRR